MPGLFGRYCSRALCIGALSLVAAYGASGHGGRPAQRGSPAGDLRERGQPGRPFMRAGCARIKEGSTRAGGRPAHASQADRKAIVRLMKGRHRTGVVDRIDIQGQWAEVTIRDSPVADTGFAALLRKTRGRWRVLMEGQDFTGAGRKYGVPRSLWRRWNLE